MRSLLTADWTQLVVATFETDLHLLKKYIPAKTELNDWNGKYYMSLLGFMFSKPSLAGIPSPFFRSFEEINLRFYTRYKKDNAWKKAVVFIKEIAPSRLVGCAAKWLYHENFITLPTKHIITANKDEQRTEYYWKVAGNWNYLKMASDITPGDPDPASLEAFIHDHYWGCTKQSETKTREFQIEHRPWKIYSSRSFDMNLDAAAVYGNEFSEYFQHPPSACFLMDGSRTNVSVPVLI
jgi:uncharacterized protein YqjF (DUF2071 family)